MTAGAMRAAVPVQMAASALVVASTFVPWAHSGRRSIDVYEGGALAERLELVTAPWMLRVAVVLPLVLAISALMRWWGRAGVSAALAFIAGGYALAISAAATARLAPPVRGTGSVLALVGASFLLGAVVVEVVFSQQAARAGGRAHQQR